MAYIVREKEFDAPGDEGNALAKSDTFRSALNAGQGDASLTVTEESEGRVLFDAKIEDGEHEIGALRELEGGGEA